MRLQAFSLIAPELKELLKSHNFKAILASLKELDPVDIADGWDALKPHEQAVIFRVLPRRLQSQIFEELELEEQKILINHLHDEGTQALLSSLDPATASRFVRQLNPRLMNKFTELMKKENVQLAHQLTFPKDSVGSLMRCRFITINHRWTTDRAIEHIRVNTRLRHSDDLYLDTIYVSDENDHLVGHVFLKDLIVAPREMGVSVLMSTESHELSPETDQEEAANLFRKYKLESVPVVGADQKPIGIILFRDILKVIQQETEEDFAKMAGTRAGLLSKSMLHITKSRIPWLIISCIGYFAVGWVIKSHEGTIAKVIGLASFMPLIAAMGGNVGSQTATSVVRGMATGEVKSLGAKQVIMKEISVGLLLGSLYGVGAGLVAHLIYGNQFGWYFSLVVGSGMFASIIVAAILGVLEPFLFERANIDPATATGPLITFLADFASTSVYLAIATIFFGKI